VDSPDQSGVFFLFSYSFLRKNRSIYEGTEVFSEKMTVFTINSFLFENYSEVWNAVVALSK
jgi:hypothetical protein